LANVRAEQPGTTVRAATLFAAAWPGEKAIASAAAHRVRVAVATLRKMGLRDALLTTHDGYGLSAEIELVRA
ncbi:MAG: Signal transduction response regulator, partial [Labilithrix sp.]|nr:Signal transduction response regulator [Labilithrix sp.]